MDLSSINAIVCNAGRGIRPSACIICICDSKFFDIIAETFANRAISVVRTEQGINPDCVAGAGVHVRRNSKKPLQVDGEQSEKCLQVSNSNFRLRKRVGGSWSTV